MIMNLVFLCIKDVASMHAANNELASYDVHSTNNTTAINKSNVMTSLPYRKKSLAIERYKQ